LNGKQLATVFRIKALRRLRCYVFSVCGFGEGAPTLRRGTGLQAGFHLDAPKQRMSGREIAGAMKPAPNPPAR